MVRKTPSSHFFILTSYFFPQVVLSTIVDEIERLREEAWLGDAVLSLFVRDWLLVTRSREFSSAERAALFELFTSNQFLSRFGEPSRVEAEIGRVYRSGGVPEAFTFIEAKFLKRFLTAAGKRGYYIEKPASILRPGG